jgi:PAS domain S-box-containing protein
VNDREDTVERAVKLRWRAEEIARGTGPPSEEDLESLSPEEMRKAIHELRVYQIELKMQNEELQRTQIDLDAARARYFDLYDLAPVGYCIISLEGLILEANLTAVNLLGTAKAALIKQPITRFILKEDQDIYYLHRKDLFATGEPHACELRMVKQDGKVFWVRLNATTAQDLSLSSGPTKLGVPLSRIVLSDISERKRVEEDLAKLEAQFQQVQKRHRPLMSRPNRTKNGSHVVCEKGNTP